MSLFSTFEDRRRVFPPNLIRSLKIHGSSFMPSSHNCFDCENSFHPSGAIQDSFQFDSPEPSSQNYSFSACSCCSPNLTGASFKYPLISSRSLRSLVSKFSQVSSLVSQFLPGDSSLFFVHFNSYAGFSKFLLPSFIILILSLFKILPMVH